MLDSFNREITYMRISVTDRCNLRCIYCMPESGVELKNHNEIISYENIIKIVKEAAHLGIKKIRLTGGEPLVRKNIEYLISEISKIEGIKEIGMTTNGVLLKDKAKELFNNGLKSVNISLDTLDPEKYNKITCMGDITKVLEGIDEVLKLGFKVKLNMVVMEETKLDEIEQMKTFCKSKGIKLQLINHFSITKIKEDNYCFDRPPDCKLCNRIRLLSNGVLKPCLHSDIEIKVDMNDIRGSLIKTLNSKPEHGSSCTNKNMSQIGG